MGENQSVTGMVLLSAPVGEYDKRVVLLTKERGKITAFARGARRQNSPLLAAVNPFAFGEFELYEGRNSFTLSKASIKNYFSALTTDLKDTYYGMYFLEVADYYAQDSNDERQLLLLLYQSLRALEKKALDNRLVRCIYELRVLVVNGIYPDFFSCQHCHGEENLNWFSNGLYCEVCRPRSAAHLESSTLYALQYIVTAPLQKLYTFTVKPEVLMQLERIIGTCFRKKTEHIFKTLPFVENLF